MLISSILFISFLAIYFFRSLTYWKRKQLRCLTAWNDIFKPINTSVPEMIRIFYERIKKNKEKHMGVYLLTKRCYMAIDLDIIGHILLKAFPIFVDRLEEMNLNDIGGISLPFLYKDRWRRIRKKISPIFSPRSMKNLLRTFSSHSEKLKTHIQNLVDQNKPIDLEHVVKSFVLNSSGECLLGIDCDCLSDKKSRHLTLAHGGLHLNILQLLRLLILIIFPKSSNYLKISLFPKETIDGYTELVTENMKARQTREATKEKKEDVFQRLIDMNTLNDDGGGLTRNELIAQAAVLFVASYDTVSTLAMFSLYELAYHQDIQDRARKEVKDVLVQSKNILDYNSLQKMTYLTQIVEEAARKYPAIAFLNRCCTQDYKVPGTDLVLDNGTLVFIPVHGIHHDPNYYPEPQKFDPERFCDEEKRKRHPCAYLPFGIGPRNCPGSLFDTYISKLAMAQILNNFILSLNEKTCYPTELETMSLAIQPKKPILLNFQRLNY